MGEGKPKTSEESISAQANNGRLRSPELFLRTANKVWFGTGAKWDLAAPHTYFYLKTRREIRQETRSCLYTGLPQTTKNL